MRVRHLQTHLQEEHLIYQNTLESLRGTRIGIDAVFWLRSIQVLKDPFADALGGVPPGIFGFIDRELSYFRKYEITPLFIFQGIAPGPQSTMAANRMETQMDMAWTYLAKGHKNEAQKFFAISTSRINGDFVYFIFHHLRQRGAEVLMAPYFSGPQLAHFAEHNVVQAVFGPPGLLLYNLPKVIIQIKFGDAQFDWVDQKTVLTKWNIDKEQFIDACLLAGTEYSMTYPLLPHTGGGQQSKFNFDAAFTMVKQSPLINWMQKLPNEDMRNAHVDGHCVCKVLVQSSPVLHATLAQVRPLGNGSAKNGNGQKVQVPVDFHQIMGSKLPDSLYFLMAQGVLSCKIPQAFAKGEWLDKTQPLVDTAEFRQFLDEIHAYREYAINTVARRLQQFFQERPIIWKHGVSQVSVELSPPKEIKPDVSQKTLRWVITEEALKAEMRRQNVEKVDMKFCLTWHADQFTNDGQLCTDLQNPGACSFSKEKDCLAALVHFMLLEGLGYIADDGSTTIMGDVLMQSPRHFMEPCLIALELMKFGFLTSEPFEPAQESKQFPKDLNYGSQCSQRQKSIYLLIRVMSLLPMKLKLDMWNADVNFDLAAFHSLVRILKRSLRHLTEAALASVLLEDLSQVKLLPAGFLCATPKSNDHLQSHALLPSFMLPRSCMGIVANFFLTYEGPPERFQADLSEKFPCCLDPVPDLKLAIVFWEVTRNFGEKMRAIGGDDMAEEMNAAHLILQQQQKRLGFYPDPSALRGDESSYLQEICKPAK